MCIYTYIYIYIYIYIIKLKISLVATYLISYSTYVALQLLIGLSLINWHNFKNNIGYDFGEIILELYDYHKYNHFGIRRMCM